MNAAILPAPPVYRMPTRADNARALLFAVLIHVCAGLLMFVGVWFSLPEPMIDAGEQTDIVMVGLSQGPPPKPVQAPKAPPTPVPPAPKPVEAPKPEVPKPQVEKPKVEPAKVEPVGKPDDVTDQRIVPPKVEVDPLAQALEAQERKQQLEEQRRQQLEEIRAQRKVAELARLQEEQKLQALNKREAVRREMEAQAKAAEAARQARIASEQEAAIRGTVDTDDLAAQWRNAVRISIESQWNLPTGTDPGLQCNLRVSAIQGGTIVGVSIMQPCQLSEALQQTLVDAANAASPLPYEGFQSVFQNVIPIQFITPES